MTNINNFDDSSCSPMITETPVIPPRICHPSLLVAFSALNSALVRPPLGRPFVKTARGGPWGSHAVARPLLRCLGQHLLRIQLIDTPTVEFISTTLEKGSNRLNWSCSFGMIRFFLYLFLEVAMGTGIPRRLTHQWPIEASMRNHLMNKWVGWMDVPQL